MRQVTFVGGVPISVASLSGLGIGRDGLDLEVWDRQRFHGLRPQTSAGFDTNGSPTVVVDRATPDPAGSPAFGDPFARSAAIPRRGQR